MFAPNLFFCFVPSNSISILYGGSVTPENSQDIFSLEDVDGGLIGGASLSANDFNKIINSITSS